MRKLIIFSFPFHDHSNLQLLNQMRANCVLDLIFETAVHDPTRSQPLKGKAENYLAGQKSDVLCPNYTEITPSLRLIQAATCVSTSFFIFWSLRFSNLQHNDSASDIISQSKEVFFLEILKTIIKTPKDNLQNLRSSSYDVMSSLGGSPSPQPQARTPPRSPFDR